MLAHAPLFAGSPSDCRDEPPLEVAHVELPRMQGKWIEIASLPRHRQAGCTGTTAEYRLIGKTELRVVNECHEATWTDLSNA